MQYSKLVEVYEKIENTTKRLEKTDIIAPFLRDVPVDELDKIILMLQGKLFPPWDERKIGVAARLVLKAINIATGIETPLIEEKWKQVGDLGDAAQQLVKIKKQQSLFSKELTVDKVFRNLRKLTELEGQGTVDKKIKLIAELLTSAKPAEAKYIIRTVLEELRVGLGQGTIRDCIVWAYFSDDIGLSYDSEKNKLILPDDDRENYTKYCDAVQDAYNLSNDFSKVAKAAKTKGLAGLAEIDLTIFNPIKVMLAQKVKDVKEGFERVGLPCAVEFKYDGFRIQAHKQGDKVLLFTRRLENVTKQFPDVVEYIKEHVSGESFVIDCEAVGFDPKTKKYLPFQNISQRIKRKYNIHELAEKFPVELNVFDILFYDGKNLIKTSFNERTNLVDEIIKNPTPKKIQPARKIIVEREKDAEKFYQESLSAGNEGVMLKNLEAPYKPGSRVGFMVKLKPVMDTLDLVITGAEWGEGKRSQWLSSFRIACIDPETGEFLDLGQVGTGIKEKKEEGFTFADFTELLKPLIVKEEGRTVIVKPKIVIEVNYEEIQKSPTYSSGYALRFPRFVNIREDRSPDEISTIYEVEDLYEMQRGR